MKRLLVALLLLAPAARAAVAKDVLLTNGSQAGIAIADFVSATFNIAASRVVVVGVAFESDPSNFPTTLTWTGGTPACATAFTRQAVNGYNDGVGDSQVAEVWTAWTTSACTGVGFTHHNAIGTGTIGLVAGAVSFSGGQQAIPIGSAGLGPNTSASGTVNVSDVAVNTGSMIVGVYGSANTTVTLTENGVTTRDFATPLAGVGSTYSFGHSTSLTGGAGTVTIGATDTITFRVGAVVEINDASIVAPSTCVPSLSLLGVSAC